MPPTRGHRRIARENLNVGRARLHPILQISQLLSIARSVLAVKTRVSPLEQAPAHTRPCPRLPEARPTKQEGHQVMLHQLVWIHMKLLLS